MRAMSGPGQTLPRASTRRVIATVSRTIATTSDEQGHPGVLRALHELTDAGGLVHEVDEVRLRLSEEVHRHRARVNLHVPELLRDPEGLDRARHVLLLQDLREGGRHVRVVRRELRRHPLRAL